MTPDPIILLTPDARLDVLISLMHDALAKAKRDACEESWELHSLAWMRLHEELMCQIDRPSLAAVPESDLAAQEMALDADR